MQRVVLDTCALIYLFLDHPHIPKAKSYADSVEFVIESDAYEVFIPTMVGVELLGTPAMRAGASTPPISNAAVNKAKDFLFRRDFTLVEADSFVMETAGELCLERLIRPADAMIVASGIAASCQSVFTYDDKLIKACTGLNPISVTHPPAAPYGDLFSGLT
ncbi:type II toxin-antitoxin system VapC family toxin [Corynebacterium minutissimum]|uniref:type II toxin-antitoxin system VapC family toxin n=1 Tax=Corynebacterium minutissimum TaxID=38301 RepID=UPI000E0E6E78|nr:PIN domain-containing protein [Corynebacterium minutissimum]QRP60576.1 PIN domain-containing protein [Corynebacterium minutissimum]